MRCKELLLDFLSLVSTRAASYQYFANSVHISAVDESFKSLKPHQNRKEHSSERAYAIYFLDLNVVQNL